MINTESLLALAANLPSPYKENAEALLERMAEVVEGIGDEPIRWKPNMLKIISGQTARDSYPRTAGVGDFLLGEDVEGKPLKFIPLIVWDGRQYWSPDKDEKKMLCNSPDAKLGYIGSYCNQCPHSKWDEAANRSDCGKIKSSLFIKEDFSDIFITNFSKTNYASGMDLVAMLKKAGVAPYRRIYELSTKQNGKNSNVDNYVVKPAAEKAVKPELLAFLAELFKTVQSDRKESLESFYKVVMDRRDRTPHLAIQDEADTTVLLTDETGAESNVSEMAKNYVV